MPDSLLAELFRNDLKKKHSDIMIESVIRIRITPQGKTCTEMDGPLKTRHETKQDIPRVAFRQTELVQSDSNHQPYPGNDKKVRK